MAKKKSLIIKLSMPSLRQAAVSPSPPILPSLAPLDAVPAAAVPDDVVPKSADVPVTVPKITTYFTQSQLALALSIVKSKPKDISIRDYSQQLRNCIRTGKPTPNEELRYVDAPEFWRAQYTTIHSEKELLEAKVHRLEEAQRQLQSRLDERDHRELSEESETQPLDGQFMNGPNIRKRPAMDERPGALLGQEDGNDTSPVEDILLALSSSALRIKQQRSVLESTSEQATTVDNFVDVVKQGLQLLALLTKCISDCCFPLILMKVQQQNSRTISMLKRVMDEVAVSFLACFKALNELCRTIAGRAKRGDLVYRMISFFNESLSFFRTVCEAQKVGEASKDRDLRQKRIKTDIEEYAVNKLLAKMLSSILYSLEWKLHQPGHSDLLEGVLYFILEYVGKLVSEATFGEHVTSCDNPGNITTSTVTNSKGLSRFEGRYIIQILHMALGGASRKDLVLQVLAGKSSSSGEPRTTRLQGPAIMSSELFSKSKLLLQNTFMKNAVGTSGHETLRIPSPPIEEMQVAINLEEKLEEYGSECLARQNLSTIKNKTAKAVIGKTIPDIEVKPLKGNTIPQIETKPLQPPTQFPRLTSLRLKTEQNIPQYGPETFRLFPKLPLELQQEIWNYAVDALPARLVSFEQNGSETPALATACQASRRALEKKYVEFVRYENEFWGSSRNWVSYDRDMVYCPRNDWRYFSYGKISAFREAVVRAPGMLEEVRWMGIEVEGAMECEGPVGLDNYQIFWKLITDGCPKLKKLSFVVNRRRNGEGLGEMVKVEGEGEKSCFVEEIWRSLKVVRRRDGLCRDLKVEIVEFVMTKRGEVKREVLEVDE